ncbi:hypothetical protein GUJ93_ZPchr0007g5871 [Zizania palustris]|uniref:Glycoside hydrolase family 31 N-terminal domain-containing protein n=1 Tax=Zizania palustris TaxID=103762 RepID=A0A8J5W5A3_ZIZPA|nr:hypothetical protein GUJ93_ZPchr0007g5871 [Zizania palustris]
MLATSTHKPASQPLLFSHHHHSPHLRFGLGSHQSVELRGSSPRSRPPRLLPHLRLLRLDSLRRRCCCGGGGRAGETAAVVEAGRMAGAAAAAAADMVWVRVLEEGVFRFDASEAARAAAGPSLSFVEPRRREEPREGADGPAVVPACQVVGGLQKVLIKLLAGTSFYGTGEASGPLERTGKRVFTWNTDAWGFGPGTTSLYQSHPWVLAILPDGKALGVLADTTRRCEIDLREESTIKFSAPSAFPVITFGPFNTPAEVMTSLSHAIGISHIQSLHMIVRTFREKGIPCDVVWMDIDYMDGFRCFSFDSNRFPVPKSMVDDLHSIGCKAIWMLDPGIKKEDGYFVYETGSANDVWIKKADDSPFIGEVWPGDCVFPDFTCERTRTWWASLVTNFISNGVDGIWNDMNEPAVFKVYGMLMARSTYEGMAKADTAKRPFVLTRAGFIGSQRYAATWTGDNLSNWHHLHMSLPMVLQLGLSGQPLSGPDIGGFAGNATPRLFGRWMGVGALFPFSRGHTETGSIDHEPWSFGEEGTPVAAPVFFADPQDPELRKIETSFLLGPLLVCASMYTLFDGLVTSTSLSIPLDSLYPIKEPMNVHISCQRAYGCLLISEIHTLFWGDLLRPPPLVAVGGVQVACTQVEVHGRPRVAAARGAQRLERHERLVMERFVEALNYYAALFDGLELGAVRGSVEHARVERWPLGEEIKNFVACDRALLRTRHAGVG